MSAGAPPSAGPAGPARRAVPRRSSTSPSAAPARAAAATSALVDPVSATTRRSVQSPPSTSNARRRPGSRSGGRLRSAYGEPDIPPSSRGPGAGQRRGGCAAPGAFSRVTICDTGTGGPAGAVTEGYGGTGRAGFGRPRSGWRCPWRCPARCPGRRCPGRRCPGRLVGLAAVEPAPPLGRTHDAEQHGLGQQRAALDPGRGDMARAALGPARPRRRSARRARLAPTNALARSAHPPRISPIPKSVIPSSTSHVTTVPTARYAGFVYLTAHRRSTGLTVVSIAT